MDGAEFLRRKVRLLSLITALAVILCLCGCRREKEGPEDQIIYYRIDSEPVTLDPQIANDSAARLIIMNIFEGLVRLDKNDDIIPGAAQSWDISTDKMRYTFHLRDGLKWNDGTSLKAEDFVYGFQRTFVPSTMSDTADTLYCIKNAEAVNKGEMAVEELGIYVTDEKTIVIQLEYPSSDFLQLLTTPPAMPCQKEFFEKTSGQYGREADKILCNGAFYIRENGWEHDSYLYLRNNRNYTGEKSVIPAGVNLSIEEEPADVVSAIEKGKFDCASVTSADVERSQSLGMHLTGFGDTVWGISFNTRDEVLGNKKIRCALLSSIEREKILKEIPSHCTVTENIIPESAELDNISYRSIVGNISPVYEDKTSVLLNKGMKETNCEVVTNITILCSDDEDTQSIVNNIIEKWNSLTNGYFNKKTVPLSELKDRIESGHFEVVIAPLTIGGNTPVSTLEMFSSESRYNCARLNSEEYDKLLSGIRRNLNYGSVNQIKDAEQYLVDNGIFYPLYTENRYYASAENVTGIIFHSFGAEADFRLAVKQP